jgi:hypothetical protein
LKREVERREILDERDVDRLQALPAEEPAPATSMMFHTRARISETVPGRKSLLVARAAPARLRRSIEVAEEAVERRDGRGALRLAEDLLEDR